MPGIERTLALSAYLVDATTHHLKDMGISTDAANYYNIAILRREPRRCAPVRTKGGFVSPRFGVPNDVW